MNSVFEYPYYPSFSQVKLTKVDEIQQPKMNETIFEFRLHRETVQ